MLVGLISACTSMSNEAPVELKWRVENRAEDNGAERNTFIIKNVSGSDIDNNWCIYFSQLPRGINRMYVDNIVIEPVNGNYFRMRPTEKFQPLHSGDSLVVSYEVSKTPNTISYMPEGTYWISTTEKDKSTPLPVKLEIIKPQQNAQSLNSYAQQLYGSNEAIDTKVTLRPSDILPSVKSAVIAEHPEMLKLENSVSLKYDEQLANEGEILKEKLSQLYDIKTAGNASVSIVLALSKDTIFQNMPEKYTLKVNKDGVHIESASAHGIFNGVQTLLSLLKKGGDDHQLAYQQITDYPDLAYRGLMLDVSRNFTTADNVKKMIDIMASYKLNVLHFHITDDEGWRLEIPGLEELTTVGAHRGHTTDESQCLYPGYDGGFDPQAPTSGNGYYTRQQFIDILQYAAKRHVQVIPEIESPGHSRAAIVAMKARYAKYAKTDKTKATEYMLHDPADKSTYVSAQAYKDNVMNVALPSSYKFMKKVIDEVQKMYAEAGVALTEIHLGGDEVPEGAWMKSPLCQELMKRENMTAQHDLFEYFYRQMADYMKQKGLKVSGWQEIALHNGAATDAALLPTVSGVYCWNTVPEWGGDVVPYTVANKGYGVILCNVNNFYVDLMYTPTFEEKGLSWGGTVNEAKTFSALPYSIYRSSRTNVAGQPVNIDSIGIGKVALRPENIKNIKGVQAQLFSETIRTFDDVTSYVFPKVLGLVERGWNAHPTWETLRGDAERKAFEQDLSRFYACISQLELPYLNKMGVKFRLPNPGMEIKDGKLYANSPISGAEIRYTTDGTDPTSQSTLWKQPVACKSGTIKARLFYLNRESVVTTIVNP